MKTKIVITDPVVADRVRKFFDELNKKKRELKERFSKQVVKKRV